MTPSPSPLTETELEAALSNWELVLSPETIQLLREGQYENGRFRRLRVEVEE